MVATITKSISFSLKPELLIASIDAFIAIEEVLSLSAAICLCLIPVLSTIHSSVVSTSDSKSLFVRTFCGK